MDPKYKNEPPLPPGEPKPHNKFPKDNLEAPDINEPDEPRQCEEPEPKIEYRDKIVYRDRPVEKIVYRDRPKDDSRRDLPPNAKRMPWKKIAASFVIVTLLGALGVGGKSIMNTIDHIAKSVESDNIVIEKPVELRPSPSEMIGHLQNELYHAMQRISELEKRKIPKPPKIPKQKDYSKKISSLQAAIKKLQKENKVLEADIVYLDKQLKKQHKHNVSKRKKLHTFIQRKYGKLNKKFDNYQTKIEKVEVPPPGAIPMQLWEVENNE